MRTKGTTWMWGEHDMLATWWDDRDAQGLAAHLVITGAQVGDDVAPEVIERLLAHLRPTQPRGRGRP